MGRHEEEDESSARRHGRHKASPSPPLGEETEEAIRNKLRESGWKKRRTESESTADAETSKDREKAKESAAKSSPRGADDHRSFRTSRSSRRSRSPRRRDREHRSSRRKSSGSRRRSPSRSRSRSRSRSSGRRRRRHSSSSRKRRSSRSPSRGRDSKRSRRVSSRSRSTSVASKRKTSLSLKSEDEKEKNEKTQQQEEKNEKEKEDEDETETENEDDGDKMMKEAEKEEKEGEEKKEKEKEERHRSRKSSRRSRSGSPRSPSRSSRRRRHRRNSSYSRSPSRSRRSRRGGSRSRSRSPPRDRRSRGRDRDRDRRSRRRGRSYSRSRSPSYIRRRRRSERSSSRDRSRRDAKKSPEPQQAPPPATDAAPAAATGGTAPAAPASGVNPTITQLMAQYPTMSLQDIIAKMQASNVTMAAAVAQKPARELYVGNLPPNVTGPQLQEFLSTIIQQVGLTTQPGNPIVNTWISTDGHFAFCEMRSVEECNLALLLNQLSLLGQPLKFGRPRSFMGPPQPMPQVSARTQTALTNLGCTPNPAWFAQSAVPGIADDLSSLEGSTLAEPFTAHSALSAAVGTTAVESGSTSNNLIMSNIPVVLAEDQVKELVEPFGALRSFTLVKDSATGASLGSALFEYEDSAVTAQAVEGLNGLDIGGILLSVQRQPASNGAALGAGPNSEDQPSPVLKMANMVSIDELRDDEEYADLAEDVEEECKRFGDVTGMEIPRPQDGEDVPGLGCIYVRFGKEEDAVSALKALNGRKFGGNIVKVTYFSVDNFEKREFS